MTFIGLAFPILLAVALCAAGWLRNTRPLIEQLNRYALRIAFPALVCAGMATAPLDAASRPAFWLLVPASLLLSMLPLLALAKLRANLRPTLGSVAMTSCFGNVAYVGLPLCTGLLGEQVLGTASLAVALHIAAGLPLGSYLLLRCNGQAGGRSLVRMLRQPLLWAPVAGVLCRLSPQPALLADLLRPIGASASPVALFVLGLYLHSERSSLRVLDLPALGHACSKLLLLPAVTFGLTTLLTRWQWLSPEQATLLLLMSAMPTGISTFSLAHEFGVGSARVAQSIVTTTLLSLLLLPALAWWVLP